jgi:hypothetical protein
MRPLLLLLSGMILGTFVGVPPVGAAEEAYRTDGRRVTGSLTLGEDGALRFAPAVQGTALSHADIARVLFPMGHPPAFRAGGGHRVHLHDGQHLTGELLALKDDTLTLRTAWTERLNIPRAFIAGITSLPGWRTVFEDDLSKGSKEWAVSGKPARESGSVVVSASGQDLSYTLHPPLEAGRLGVNFQETRQARGLRFLFEARFAGDAARHAIRVTIAGPGDTYEVEVNGLEGTAHRVARSPGWRRLSIQFKPDSLRITCDEEVLWYNLTQGPGGPLRQVRLVCTETGTGRGGAVAWTAFTVERPAREPSRTLVAAGGDPEQDELWLADGDQLFGRVVRLDRRGVELEARFGRRSFPWAVLAGCYFRRTPLRSATREGTHVRLGFYPGLTPDPDILEGVVKRLDQRTLTLHHPYLGELNLPRSALHDLRPPSSPRAREGREAQGLQPLGLPPGAGAGKGREPR